MRTLNATLEAAIEAESFNAYIKGKFQIGITILSVNILKYKLTATEIIAEVDNYAAYDYFIIERGVTISGTNYTLSTSKFYIERIEVDRFEGTLVKARIFASLFPKQYISISGDDTYENVITAFCTEFGKTAVFDQPTADLWSYQFLPSGKNFISSNAQRSAVGWSKTAV